MDEWEERNTKYYLIRVRKKEENSAGEKETRELEII